MATTFLFQNFAALCVLYHKDRYKQLTIDAFDGQLFIPFFTVLQEASFIQMKPLRLKKNGTIHYHPTSNTGRFITK